MKPQTTHAAVSPRRIHWKYFAVAVVLGLLVNACTVNYPYYYHSDKLKIDLINQEQKIGLSIDTMLFYSARISQGSHYLVRLPYRADTLFTAISGSLLNHAETLELNARGIQRIEKQKAFLNDRRRRRHIIDFANEHVPSGNGVVLVAGIEYIVAAEQAGGGGIELPYYTGYYHHHVRHRMFLIGLNNREVYYFNEVGRVTSERKDNHVLNLYGLHPAISDSLVDVLVNAHLTRSPL